MWAVLAQVTGLLSIPAGLSLQGKEEDIVIGIILGYGVLIIVITWNGILTLLLALAISIVIFAMFVVAKKKLCSIIGKRQRA